MENPEQPVLRDIVLVGGGHSHVGVLRRFAMDPEPGVRLTLICRDTDTPYSGMLPGYVAGHYDFDQVHIDLRRLAAFAGARFFSDEVVGIDRKHRQVICRDHPPVAWDRLSINIGSTPRVRDVPGAMEHSVPVKPINRFNERWQALLQRLEATDKPLTVAVVGGGAGGVELTLSMQYRLKQELAALGHPPGRIHFRLFQRETEILPTHNKGVRRIFNRILRQRDISVHCDTTITTVRESLLETGDGRTFDADEVLWVTQAGGPEWLRDTGLPLDERGFIQVRDTLQSLTDDHIFAAGDIATLVDQPREKAGVFAVRQGPWLADNLRRSVCDDTLLRYQPQKRWLALISTGDRRAVASRGHWAFSGAWVWRWKDWIDRRFMARFNDLPAMEDEAPEADHRLDLAEEEGTEAISALAMRCGGCGAKVGTDVLSRALDRIQPVEREEVLLGLQAPDDAAMLRLPPDKALVQTVDFFRAFIDDPFVFGEIAANHALGDIYAMGADPVNAMALATVPPGLESKTEDLLFQLMSGAVATLNRARCSLSGGHTGEGRELALGFSVNGLVDPESALRKSGLRPGDLLILTKPLGTGTLLAAHPRLAARGRWIDAALASMRQSSRVAADCLMAAGAKACTDITGFGLLGHLLEMTRASGVDAELDLDALPLLAGVEQTLARGITSSLQPANVRLRRAIRNQAEAGEHGRYPVLFDPQTAGGLLAGVSAENAEQCLNSLRDNGYTAAAIIGRVKAGSGAMESVVLNL